VWIRHGEEDPGRGSSPCKGPEVGAGLSCVRNTQGCREARAEGMRPGGELSRLAMPVLVGCRVKCGFS
jgi:hypothetical protein